MDGKVGYPAVLVLARFDAKARTVIGFVDDKRILNSDADLDARLALYRRLEDLGGLPYTGQLAEVADAERVLAERVRWLEFEHGLRASPDPDPEPEPTPDLELETPALSAAYQAARAALGSDPNQAARLDRALELVKTGAVKALGDGQWQVTGQAGKTYTVNGACQCPDYTHSGRPWCKHRLAVALVVKAQKIEAGSAANTPAPEAQKGPSQVQNTTDPQPRQIELVIAYETDEAGERPRIHNGGELVTYKTDGQPIQPPSRDLDALYRWLQSHNYAPANFQWLGRRVGGKRQRRQVYALASA